MAHVCNGGFHVILVLKKVEKIASFLSIEFFCPFIHAQESGKILWKFLTSLNFWLAESKLVMVVLATTWPELPERLIRLSEGGDKIRSRFPVKSPSIDASLVIAPLPVGSTKQNIKNYLKKKTFPCYAW